MKPALAATVWRSVVRRRGRLGAVALAATMVCAAATPAGAQSLAQPAPSAPRVGSTIADFIAEASQRFGIPQGWIVAVMRAESAFDPRATSPKGAMGLMQLMPDTWATLRSRLDLGLDPYDPRDNILAGGRYLRDLYDQFGVGGFLAAYNAGPGRYLDFLTRERPLPEETRAYVVKVGAAIDGRTNIAAPSALSAPAPPPRPGIFVALSGRETGVATAAPLPPNDVSVASPFAGAGSGSVLFVSVSGRTAR
jgi:soluble lytic murein transglycosylase-like protein